LRQTDLALATGRALQTKLGWEKGGSTTSCLNLWNCVIFSFEKNVLEMKSAIGKEEYIKFREA
jgi:hypothetical protein